MEMSVRLMLGVLSIQEKQEKAVAIRCNGQKPWVYFYYICE
jgi:hypothetical protein